MRRRLGVAGAATLVAVWGAAAYYLWGTEVPGDLQLPELDQHRFFEDRDLSRAARYERFLRWNSLASQAGLLGVLALYAWRGARFARESAAGRIGTGMLLGMIGLALVWIVQIPFGIADLWWQRRYGIWREGYLEWLVENWVALGAEFLFVCLFLIVTMALARPLRDRWWMGAVPIFGGLALLFAFLLPYLVPDTRPLRRPALAADAGRLAAAHGLEEVEVRVQRVSDLTTAPNAFAAGLGPSRRVVLADTLLDGRFRRDEVRVVLAHEFGHHARSHIWKGLGWSVLFAVPTLFLVARVVRRRGGLYEPRAVPLALLALVVLELAGQPLASAVSRRLEAEADWVALETSRDPAAARRLFRRFTKTALTQPRPPEWWQAFFGTHPAIMERIEMADAWAVRRLRSRQATRRPVTYMTATPARKPPSA